MAFTSFSRRRMLAAFAAAGGASRLGPFLPASAYAAAAPKRILTVFHPMGYLEKSFFPQGTQNDFTLGETMTDLDPWKNKTIFLDGMNLYGIAYFFNFKSNEHGIGEATCFTGAKYDEFGGATGPSIDQAVADFQYAQVKTRFRSISLGVNAGDSSPFYRSSKTKIRAQGSAQATFDMLFDGFAAPNAPSQGPTAPAPVDTTSRDRLRSRRQSVMNLVKRDLDRLRKLSGRDDQAKLDAHLEGISSIENRLKLSAAQSTEPKGTSSGPLATAGSITQGCAKPSTMVGASIQSRVHMQMDLIAAAFACDLTRHASLQLGDANGGMDEAVPGVGQHETTHAVGDAMAQPKDVDNHKKYDRWYAARWAYLLNKLDSIKEGNGTMLDNTLIVFGQDTTTNTEGGLSGFGAHYSLRFPMFLAGGGNFAFKTGQYLKIPRANSGGSVEAQKKLVSHQRLLTSIGQAFGMDINTFGDHDPGTGPLTQLTRV